MTRRTTMKIIGVMVVAALPLMAAGIVKFALTNANEAQSTTREQRTDAGSIVWDIRRGRDPRLFGVTAANDGFHLVDIKSRRAIEVVFRDDIRFTVENVTMAKVEVASGQVESFYIRGPAMTQQEALIAAQRMTTHSQYIKGDVSAWYRRLAKNDHGPFIAAVLKLEEEPFNMSLELIPDVTYIDPLGWALLISAEWIRPSYQDKFRDSIWRRKHQPIKQYGTQP